LQTKIEGELGEVVAKYYNNDAKKMIEEHKVVLAGGVYSKEAAQANKVPSKTQKAAQ